MVRPRLGRLGSLLVGAPGDPPAPAVDPRRASRDSLFLAAVMALSCVLYLPDLGLYSDDWSFLAHLHGARHEPFPALFRAILDDGLFPRPLQALNLALLYRLSGLEPLGYHVANSLVLVASVVLFYHVLRKVGAAREIALAIPLVFGLLPHYSTDRFWIAAAQANLSVLALLASLYFDLLFAGSSGARRWSWKLLGTAALLASVLAYEVTGPLFLLTPFLVAYGTRRPDTGPERRPRRPWHPLPLLLAANVAALALAVVYKSAFTDRTGLSGALLWRIRMTVREATLVGFGGYGLGLPLKVWRSVRDHFDPAVLLLSVLLGLGVWAYLHPRRERPFPGPASWVRLLAAGAIVFGAGYGAALVTLDIGFDTTGINNRTAVAAALGVACVFVATGGLVSGWLPRRHLRWKAFAVLVALTASSGVLLVNTIGTFWVSAAEAQERIIGQLRTELPDPRPGSVVLLDGVCPYRGPAIVFETGWDVTGMLRLVYDDPTLRGDVLKPSSELREEGIRTILYDDVVNEYPYGERLLVFRPEGRSPGGGVQALADLDAARRILDPGREWPCPPGEEGYGVRIF